ncbi:MAG TPA: kelch repeat-containing protein [Candidatus Acidoferrum sp.]|nr:kelch repeat-containing protein [Candidatus Acidoferrum sp.]
MKTTLLNCFPCLSFPTAVWIMLCTAAFPAYAQDCTYWVCRFNGQPGNGIGSPGQRVHHAMAYDSDRGVTVFFGGEIGKTGSEAYFNDTWEYDGTNQWHQINVPGAKPGPRSFHSMVYDRARHYVLLHGGQAGGNSFNDIWAYTSDGVTGTWTPLAANIPRAQCLEVPKVAGHAMIYDSVVGVSRMIGGYDGIYTANQQHQGVWPIFDDVGDIVDCGGEPRTVTYAWDGDNWYGYAFYYPAPLWGYIDEAWYLPNGNSKFAAYGVAAAFDDYHGIAIGLGGYTQPYEQTQLPSGYFTYVPNTNCYKYCTSIPPEPLSPGWEYNPDPSLPPPLAEASMAYDSQRHHIVLVGGVNGDVTDSVYDYVYTGNRTNRTGIWSTLPSIPANPLNGASSARAGAAMVFDSRRGVFVLMGGAGAGAEVDIPLDVPRGPGSRFSDTWELVISAAGIVASSQGEFDHCVGDTAILSVTPSGLNATIQWYRNGVAIPGATHELLVLNNLATTNSGNYVARVQNDCGYADTPKTFLRVDVPITLFRQALFPDCSATCIGSNTTIHPPLPVYTGIDLNTHLQKNIGSAEFPAWVDVRVDTPAAPANFVFTNLDKSFSGDYRFYIDGSACPGIVASLTNHIQVGFDIIGQPQSLANIRPCDTIKFSIVTAGGCGLSYRWLNGFGKPLLDDGHFIGTQTPILTINGVHYDDEGSYMCMVIDTNQCNNAAFSASATLKLTLPQWVLRTTNGPSPRYGNDMAYDSVRGVTVMYSGGYVDATFGYTGYGDLWEWDGSRWRQKTTYNWTNAWHQVAGGYWAQNFGDTPAARMQHAMAYDTRRGRVVMFGGRSSDGHEYGDYSFNDTWEWDGTRWYFRTTNGPPATFDRHMAYDAVRGVTVLYGGFDAGAATVWEWDGTNWTSISPTNGPVASYYQDDAALIYDSFLGTVFGGPTTDGFYTRYFWTWDGHNWHPRAAGFENFNYYTPQYGEMVYDTYRYRSFHFGGLDQTIGFNGSSTSAYYDSASDTWTLLADAAQTSAFGTTDFFNVSVLVRKLAGQADPVSQYLWNQFDTNTQQVLTNPSSTFDQLKNTLAAALNNIINHNIVYDSNLFAAVILSTETQVFKAVNPQHKDLVRFNRLLLEDAYPADIVRSPSTPPGRYYFGMVFDSVRRAAMVMGGYYNGPGLNPLNGSDTWELMYLDTPLINDQPASQYRAPGGTAVFAVNAVAPYGSTLTYNWYFATNALNDGGRISGSHSPTLRIANVHSSDGGQYQARISAACGTISTLPAILTTDPRLQIFSAQQGSAQLVWSAANLVLEQADTVTGPWSVVSGASSPFDLTLNGPGKFFRLNTNSPAGP